MTSTDRDRWTQPERTSPVMVDDITDTTPSGIGVGIPGEPGLRSSAARAERSTPKRQSKLGRDTHKWSRLIHVYTSMIALVVVLFFALTGITLNHPDWTFGSEVSTTTESGTFPFPTQLVADDGSSAGIDYLSISEYVRDEYGVVGEVDSFSATNGSGAIAYTNPGYRADLFFDVEAATFDLSVEQEGWVAVINDLHKGRSTDSSWGWLIDVTAGFLVVISLSGLLMQFFLKKRRRSAFVVAGVGTAITIALVVVTLS